MSLSASLISKQVSRLAHPILLMITLLPQASSTSPKPVKLSDPEELSSGAEDYEPDQTHLAHWRL
ncbi:hypothetical protein CY34DRAFT_18147 [Suillus luteus UH-Slu-Lm8-n1]|uniref:Uncharacterized protein n=1 Tax=Suillus luteus UH-Slu-Lm8-n1 TaxID=930992 RepID=A0A0C9Z8G7_9AGAM|nr:hypothetical protein CY34DRAFT_18147 [Suillus luteus UH-Slu-Lm8-n1]